MATRMINRIDIDTTDDFPEQAPAVAQYQFLIRYCAYAAARVVGFSWFPMVALEGIVFVTLFPADDNDPTGQAHAALVCIGAALGAFRLAARRFGHTAEVTIFPDPDRPDIVARVTLGAYHEASLDDRLRFNALTAPTTSSLMDENRALPQGLIRALPHLAARSGVWISAVAAASDRMRARDCLHHVIRAGEAPDGFGAACAMRNELVGPLDLATPGLFLLGIDDCTPANSVALGEALQELVVLLHTQEVQVRMTHLSHALGRRIVDRLALPRPPLFMVAAAYGASRRAQ